MFHVKDWSKTFASARSTKKRDGYEWKRDEEEMLPSAWESSSDTGEASAFTGFFSAVPAKKTPTELMTEWQRSGQQATADRKALQTELKELTVVMTNRFQWGRTNRSNYLQEEQLLLVALLVETASFPPEKTLLTHLRYQKSQARQSKDDRNSRTEHMEKHRHREATQTDRSEGATCRRGWGLCCCCGRFLLLCRHKRPKIPSQQDTKCVHGPTMNTDTCLETMHNPTKDNKTHSYQQDIQPTEEFTCRRSTRSRRRWRLGCWCRSILLWRGHLENTRGPGHDTDTVRTHWHNLKLVMTIQTKHNARGRKEETWLLIWLKIHQQRWGEQSTCRRSDCLSKSTGSRRRWGLCRRWFLLLWRRNFGNTRWQDHNKDNNMIKDWLKHFKRW